VDQGQTKSATLPCARITLIKFQGVISAEHLATISTPSVFGPATSQSGHYCSGGQRTRSAPRCKSLRVTDPEKIAAALRDALVMARQYRVPVVVEVILEKVTNIAMGTEIDKINEFEEVDCRHPEGLKGLELAGLLE